MSSHPVPARRGLAACEPLESRRLLAAEVISLAAGGGATADRGGFIQTTSFSSNSTQASDDGRYVAFVSNSTDLVPGLTPSGSSDVYLRDRATGTTRLVSARPDGQPAGESQWPSVSGDGRYVAFECDSATILPGLTPGSQNVFLRDMVNNTTVLVSHGSTEGAPDKSVGAPAVSRNGRYVLFMSAPVSVPEGQPQPADGGLFRYDVQTGAIDAVAADFMAGHPDALLIIGQASDDGNVVAFESFEVIGSDPESFVFNCYVKDMTTGVTTLATVTADGRPLDDDGDLATELSGDGRHLLFQTSRPATPNDTNFIDDVFLRDLSAGTTTLVSVGPGGTSLPAGALTLGSRFAGTAGTRAMSADGRFVVFGSDSPVAGETDPPEDGGPMDIFLRDTVAGTTRLLSASPGDGDASTISADGRFAAFLSNRGAPTFADALALVVTDLATGQETIANRGPAGGTFAVAEGEFGGWEFNRGGNLLLFGLEFDPASELVPGVADANNGPDVIAYSLGAASIDLSAPTAAVAAIAPVTTPGVTTLDIDVTYADNTAVDATTLGTGDVVVTGPGGFRGVPAFTGATPAGSAPQVVAHYRLSLPRAFDAGDNGTWTIETAAGEVKDTAGNAAAAAAIGTFAVNVPLGDGPDLAAGALQGAVPASLVGGARQKLKPLLFTLTNTGNAPAAGTVTVRLLASADAVPDAADAVVLQLPNKKLKLAPGKSKVFKLKPPAIPPVADGDYRLIAVADDGGTLPERMESNNAALLAMPVRIAAPFVDLAVASPSLSGRLAPGKKATLLLTARNEGNQAARGVQRVTVRLTADPNNSAAASRTLETSLKLNLKPGASKLLRAKLTLPADLPPGGYFVVVELAAGAPRGADPDPSDNVATSAAAAAVQ